MSIRSNASRTTVRWFVLFTLCLLPGLASDARAQGRGPADERTLAGYRLTMPVVRELLLAMRDAEMTTEMRTIRAQWVQSGTRPDYTTMSLAELAAQFDRLPPVKRALSRAGISNRDAALQYTALVRAIQYMSQRDAAGLPGARPPAAPAGGSAAAENVALVRQNRAEIERLSSRAPLR